MSHSYSLDKEAKTVTILFDGEERGVIGPWDTIKGAEAWAKQLVADWNDADALARGCKFPNWVEDDTIIDAEIVAETGN